ncbi:ribonuclease H-like domain-containing protein, partial [Tanacetum coccineum]
LEEDDVEPGVIFDRSFLRLTKAITNFGAGTVTIYPDIDPFLEETEEEENSKDDWDHLLDFNIDDVPLLGEEGLSPFVCKMGKSSPNKKRAMENLNFFYQDIGTSSSAGGHLTQEEAAKEAIAIRMSRKFALLEEERPIIETMAYHDKYKKILDEVWKDKAELDGKIVKEEEEAVNENALADTGSNINTMPFRIYVQLGREDMKKVDRGITMINHTQGEAMGILTNVICQVGVTTLIAKFLILDIPIDRDSPIVVGRGFLRIIGGIVNTPEKLFSTFDGFCHQTFRAARSDVMRNAKSNSDDEEDYQIKRNKFGAPIYGAKPAPYLNCNDLVERSLAIETVTNPFRKISVWKKAVGFLGSLPVPLKNVNWKPDYKGSFTKEEEATWQWRTEIRLTDPYGNIYLHTGIPLNEKKSGHGSFKNT